MKYVNDAGNTLKATPVSTSLGLAGAAAATLATMRNVKLESPALQGLALATAALVGFAATYASSRGVGYGVSYARNSSMFGKSGDTSAVAPAPEAEVETPKLK